MKAREKSKGEGETPSTPIANVLSPRPPLTPKKKTGTLTKHRPRTPSAVSLELRGLLLLMLLNGLTTLREARGALGDVRRGRARVAVVVGGGGGLGEREKIARRKRC